MTDTPSSVPRRSATPVWVALILVTGAIEVSLVLADLGVWGSPRWRSLAYQYGAFWAGLLHGWAPNFSGQPFTMFASYSFLHADWQHYLGNAVTLLLLGVSLGERCGPWRFAQLYTFSALGGAIGFGILSTSPSPMVGASGALMGLLGVWIVWDAHEMAASAWPRSRIVTAVLARCALLLLLNVIMFMLLQGHLAWQTHLGGFLAGALAALVLRADPPQPSNV